MKDIVRDTDSHARTLSSRFGKSCAAFFIALLLAQPSCVMVGGYSEEGGWYIWPGSLIITGVAILLLFLFSRRRK